MGMRIVGMGALASLSPKSRLEPRTKSFSLQGPKVVPREWRPKAENWQLCSSGRGTATLNGWGPRAGVLLRSTRSRACQGRSRPFGK